jgi:hypothetical protein
VVVEERSHPTPALAAGGSKQEGRSKSTPWIGDTAQGNGMMSARPGQAASESRSRVSASAALPAPAEDKTTPPAVRIRTSSTAYYITWPTRATPLTPPVHSRPSRVSVTVTQISLSPRARIKRRRRPLLPLPLCHRPFPRSIHPSIHPKATHMDSSGS